MSLTSLSNFLLFHPNLNGLRGRGSSIIPKIRRIQGHDELFLDVSPLGNEIHALRIKIAMMLLELQDIFAEFCKGLPPSPRGTNS
ncbi:hypothetical protein Tco_0490428 [Tanacetum coccineum]